MTRRKMLCLIAAITVVAFVAAPRAEASVVTYDFTVNVTSGPLSGTSENGSFSCDSSSITPGKINNATDLLTALNFTSNGITYNATTANPGSLGFDSTGALTSLVFGTSCTAGACGIIGAIKGPRKVSRRALEGNSSDYSPVGDVRREAKE